VAVVRRFHCCAGTAVVEPIGRQRGAAISRAMQGMMALAVARDLDLAAGNRAIAKNADALIVERVPFSARVRGLQDRKFFCWQKTGIHIGNGLSKSKHNVFCHQRAGRSGYRSNSYLAPKFLIFSRKSKSIPPVQTPR